jgi:hypothetical protein
MVAKYEKTIPKNKMITQIETTEIQPGKKMKKKIIFSSLQLLITHGKKKTFLRYFSTATTTMLQFSHNRKRDL